MNIRLLDGLPFVNITLVYHGHELQLEYVLLDTGSAGSIFAAGRLYEIGIAYLPTDEVYRIRGVGGAEFVFVKEIERLVVGELQIDNFTIEVGAVDYGFSIEGILGMDFLIQVGAIVDLGAMTIYGK